MTTTLAATASATEPAHPPRVRHLLAAARAAFIAQGFAGMSIDALARDAGVSKETIYRHFPDKEALFRAALEEMGREFSSRAEAVHRAAPAVDARLAQDFAPADAELAGLAQAVLDSAVGGGLLSPWRLAADVADSMPHFVQDLQEMQWRQMEPVRRVLEDHARAGGLTAPVPLDLALDFGSLAVGGPALLLGFPAPSMPERARLAGDVAALFARGVLGADALKGAPVGAPEAAFSPAISADATAPVAPHIRALLDVAARHFLRDGFEGASLLEIGAEARVGRGTLYRHFASKSGLHAAVLRDLAAQVAAEAKPPALPDDGAERAPEGPDAPEAIARALARYAAAGMKALASPRSLALHRAAIGVAARDPALAREVHDAVREPWIAPLAAWLDRRAGVARPRWLAGALLVMALQGNRLFSAGRGLADSEIAPRAERVARLFLHGFRATLHG